MHTELEASLSSGLCLPSAVGQKSFNFLEANLSQIHSLGLQFASRNEKKNQLSWPTDDSKYLFYTSHKETP